MFITIPCIIAKDHLVLCNKEVTQGQVPSCGGLGLESRQNNSMLKIKAFLHQLNLLRATLLEAQNPL